MYYDTDEGPLPANEKAEILSQGRGYYQRTKRIDDTDKLSVNLAIKKEHSDLDIRSVNVGLNSKYAQEKFSKSFQPNQAKDVLTAMHEPSLTQATTTADSKKITSSMKVKKDKFHSPKREPTL